MNIFKIIGTELHTVCQTYYNKSIMKQKNGTFGQIELVFIVCLFCIFKIVMPYVMYSTL